MSYTTIFKVPKEGEVETYAEFNNARRGAFNVWAVMAKEYLNIEPLPVFDDDKNWNCIWGLSDSDEVLYSDRIVMEATFDKVMVKRENLLTLAKAMDDFCTRYEPGSLPEQVQTLRELFKDEDCFAVCWQQTSVTCAWEEESDEELDEYGDEISRNYDVSKDTKHYFLFDRLKL